MRKTSGVITNIILYAFWAGLLGVSYYYYINGTPGSQRNVIVSFVVYTAAFVLGLFVIYKKTGSFMSLMTFFWVSFYLFHGGQIIMYVIDWNGYSDYGIYNVFDFYTLAEIIRATHYSTICELFFIFGAMICSVKHKEYRLENTEGYMSVINRFGRTFVMVSALPFAYYVISILRVGITKGYTAINDYSNYGSSAFMKIVVIFVDIFIIGAFFLAVSNYNNKKIYRASIGVILIYSLVLLSLGERTDPSSFIVLVLWLDSYLCRFNGNVRKSNRKRILATVLLVFLTIAFPSIMALRHGGIISLSQLVNNIRQNGLLESLKMSIASLGYSMMPLIQVRRFVNSGEPLRFGTTYLAALTNIIPFLGIAKNYANLSTWLMHKMNMNYGPGFSMAAEAYLNFKDFPIILTLFGFLSSKILMWRKEDFDIQKMIRGVIFIILCLTLPRREFNSRIRDIFYMVILLPMLIDYVYKNKFGGRHNY